LGVVHFATGEYSQARERFGKVLSIVEGLSSQQVKGGRASCMLLACCLHCHGTHRGCGSMCTLARPWLASSPLSLAHPRAPNPSQQQQQQQQPCP
ncbi:unnamed protein product, partial [Ectocarpus sp. 12 AP-2014]